MFCDGTVEFILRGAVLFNGDETRPAAVGAPRERGDYPALDSRRVDSFASPPARSSAFTQESLVPEVTPIEARFMPRTRSAAFCQADRNVHRLRLSRTRGWRGSTRGARRRPPFTPFYESEMSQDQSPLRRDRMAAVAVARRAARGKTAVLGCPPISRFWRGLRRIPDFAGGGQSTPASSSAIAPPCGERAPLTSAFLGSGPAVDAMLRRGDATSARPIDSRPGQLSAWIGGSMGAASRSWCSRRRDAAHRAGRHRRRRGSCSSANARSPQAAGASRRFRRQSHSMESSFARRILSGWSNGSRSFRGEAWALVRTHPLAPKPARIRRRGATAPMQGRVISAGAAVRRQCAATGLDDVEAMKDGTPSPPPAERRRRGSPGPRWGDSVEEGAEANHLADRPSAAKGGGLRGLRFTSSRWRSGSTNRASAPGARRADWPNAATAGSIPETRRRTARECSTRLIYG